MINIFYLVLQYEQTCINDTNENIQAFNEATSSEQIQQFVNNNVLTIPCGVSAIGYQIQIYKNKDKLTHVIIPDSVQTISSSAFSRYYSLQTITLPPLLQEIQGDTFQECENLKSIKIPEGVQFIGYDAFQKCYSLSYVTIPQSVTLIRDRAFANCTLLSCVEIQNQQCTFNGNDGENGTFQKTMFQDIIDISDFSEKCLIDDEYLMECNDTSKDEKHKQYTFYIGDERKCVHDDYVEVYMNIDNENMYVKRCHTSLQYRSNEERAQQCLNQCEGCENNKFGNKAQIGSQIQYQCVEQCNENVVWIMNQYGNFCTQSQSCEGIEEDKICVDDCQILSDKKYLQNKICVQECNLEIYYKHEEMNYCVSNCRDYDQLQYERLCVSQCPEKIEVNEDNKCVEQKKSNVGLIIGIVVACVVVCVIIICNIVLIVQKKKKINQKNNQMRDNNIVQNE